MSKPWDAEFMTVDEAKKAEREALDNAVRARDTVLAAITIEWQTAADELARRIVTEQPDRTKALHQANDLTKLKELLAAEKDRSTEAIPELFRDALDLDKLVRQAKLNSHGVVRPVLSEAIKQLASGVYEILKDAGYDMGADYSNIGSFSPNDVPVNAYGATSALGRAVEEWDVARRAVTQAVKNFEATTAEDLWDQS